MLPRPSPSCVALVAGLVALVVTGVALESAAATSLAAAGLAFVGSAYAATYPLARRARTERLEFAWWLAPSDPASAVLVPGAPIEVRAFLRHRARRGVRISDLAPVLPDGLAVRSGMDGWVDVPTGVRCDFAVTLTAASVGRHLAHGLAARIGGPLGLFGVPLYFPYPLALRVLPRATRALRSASRRPPSTQGARSGRVHFPRRGGGTELRELRELVPGDPFKAIAWKPSARYGKLVVREVEHEAEAMRYAILDVGPSMRGGALGTRKLDLALEWAASNAERWLRDGDRFATATFDRRVIGRLAPGEGRAHLLRMLDLLLGATELVDDDLTEADDATVAGYVARYLRHQMGLDFRAEPRADDVATRIELVRHVQSMVGGDLGAVRARDGAGRLLRRFCQLRGLALPYRAHSSAVERTAALDDALALPALAAPAEITVVTDAEDLAVGDDLFRRIGGLRARGHVLRFVVVRTGDVAEASESTLGMHLADVHRAHEARRVASLVAQLARWGIPTDVLPTDLEREGAARRAREAA